MPVALIFCMLQRLQTVKSNLASSEHLRAIGIVSFHTVILRKKDELRAALHERRKVTYLMKD